MRILFWILMMYGISSCAPSLKYYTKDVRDQIGLNNTHLNNVQFYLSSDLKLWRELGNEVLTLTNGKIMMTEGKKVEEIVIKKGTPGVFIFSPKEQHYAISFDAKDDSKFLIFGPSAQANGRYVLLAKNWQSSHAQVTYGDYVYNTPIESAYAALMVDMKKVKSIKRNTEIIKGRRVN